MLFASMPSATGNRQIRITHLSNLMYRWRLAVLNGYILGHNGKLYVFDVSIGQP